MTMMRLTAYTPNGASLGALPTPQDMSGSWVFNDLGALSLTYPFRGPKSTLLGKPLEVAVETSADDGNTWAEPPSGRFLYLRDSRDPVTDDAWSVECLAYVNRLKKAVVGFGGLNAEGRREFVNAAPGAILAVLITEAKNRGALTGLTISFSTTTDSRGVAWAGAVPTISYEPGKDYLTILQEFVLLGAVDFTTQGRTLNLYNAGTASVDRTTTAPRVTLQRGRDLVEAPMRRTWENLADVALVQGDAGTNTTRTAAGATSPWGRQESFVTAAGVEDVGTLSVIGDAALTLTREVRAEYTHGLAFQRSPHRPFRDYFPGDWVGTSLTDGEAPLRTRVRQVTLTQTAGGTAGGNVVLNDKFTENDVATQRRLDGLTGGGLSLTGGTPTPPGVGVDILAPAKVMGLGLASEAYVDTTGNPAAQISAEWTAVTTNADGTPINDLRGYQVQRRALDGPGASTSWTTLTSEETDAFHTSSPYPVFTTWEFRVRAIDTVGNEGAWSNVSSVLASPDTNPPPMPSTPVATSRLGVITVSWDGMPANGGNMGIDLDYVEVHLSDVSNFGPAIGDTDTLVGVLPPSGGQVFVGRLTYGTTYYVRLIALDKSTNASQPSAQAPVEVKPLVDVSNFPDDAMEVLYARTGHFIDVTADMILSNIVRAGEIEAGALDAYLITAPQIQTQADLQRGIKLLASGLFAWDQAGNPKFSLSAAGTLDLYDGVYTGGRFRTASQGARVELGSGRMDFYTAAVGETVPASLDPYTVGGDSTGLRIGSGATVGRPGQSLIYMTNSLSSQGSIFFAASFLQAATPLTYSGDLAGWNFLDQYMPNLTLWGPSGQTPRFRRTGTGEVILTGAVNRGTGTSGSVAFALPVGFRPSDTVYGVVRGSVVGSTCQLAINTSGQGVLSWTGTAPSAVGVDMVFSIL